MTLQPDHRQVLTGTGTGSGDRQNVVFEFKTPVPVEKHTTYFINLAVVGNPDVSDEITWVSGVAHGDGNARVKSNGDDSYWDNGVATGLTPDSNLPTDEMRYAYTRGATGAGAGDWTKINGKVLATKITRCVSSTAQVLDFSTSGESTGCCSARVSPQGGDKGSAITITGRNFFPSDNLRCVFRDESGATAAQVPGEVLDASYTKMRCAAPTINPHSSQDCTNPSKCQGTVLQVTNDGFTTGPQYMGPKWQDQADQVDTSNSLRLIDYGVPAYLGLNPLKILFSEIYVSTTGSDTVGDGTLSRPYNTIQRAVDAANEFDQVVLLPGYYTGLGNRGLRHHGKKIQLKSHRITWTESPDGTYTSATDGDPLNTVVDCQHAPDGFILNNNKDSDSPFAGHIDTQDIVTKNCENLRIYDI